VGLTSMRERAEELGGMWTIEQVKSGGTRVLARLPYARPEPVDALVVSRPGAFNQRKPRQLPTAEQAGNPDGVGGEVQIFAPSQATPTPRAEASSRPY
jgi:hypothetical protein